MGTFTKLYDECAPAVVAPVALRRDLVNFMFYSFSELGKFVKYPGSLEPPSSPSSCFNL